jgi:hypothetical protein
MFLKRFAAILAFVVLLYGGWYIVWHSMMAADVRRVKATIDYQNQRFKDVNRAISLKAEEVAAAGFPFHFQVRVQRPELSVVSGNETDAVSIPEVILTPVNGDEGRYRVSISPRFEALYATNGHAPENYTVSVDPVPAILLRAQGDSRRCSNFPGSKPCDPVAAEAPLISFAVQLPRMITLRMALNGESKDAVFTMMPLDVPVFQTIPVAVDGPLEMFVGILRQALVFHTK